MKKFAAEFLGSYLLLNAIVGSGILITSLTDNQGVQLLVNAISAVCMLAVIIPLFVHTSGSHFNPAVSIYSLLKKEISLSQTCTYILAQVSGAILGTITANLMFQEAAITISETSRLENGTFLGEAIATSGLLLVIALAPLRAEKLVPIWIGSAYFFTSSTSFANPAVTIGRIFTNTYAGIEPGSVIGFIAAQLLAILVIFFLAPTLKESIKR